MVIGSNTINKLTWLSLQGPRQHYHRRICSVDLSLLYDKGLLFLLQFFYLSICAFFLLELR